MRISIVATSFKFDTKGVKDKVLKSVRDAMLDAVEDFLRVAAPAVPIDTGMARGSFLNMLHLLEFNGRNNVEGRIAGGIPNSPQRVLKNGKPLTYIHSGRGRYPKTPDTARTKFSTPMNQILKKVGDTVQFSYKSDVVHYNVMDEFNPYGASWHSFRRGAEAFANKLRKFRPFDVSEYVMKVTYITGTHKHGYQTTSLERVVK